LLELRQQIYEISNKINALYKKQIRTHQFSIIFTILPLLIIPVLIYLIV